MNKDRRTRIAAIDTDELDRLLTDYEVARAALSDHLLDLMQVIEELRDEEQEAFDNLPESLQESERGATITEALDALGEVIDTLQEVEETVSNSLSFNSADLSTLTDL